MSQVDTTSINTTEAKGIPIRVSGVATGGEIASADSQARKSRAKSEIANNFELIDSDESERIAASLIAATSAAMDALRMNNNNDTATGDQNQKSSPRDRKLGPNEQNRSSSSSSPSNATSATPISLTTVESAHQRQRQDSIPSYTSIFMQKQRQSNNQHEKDKTQAAAARSPLKKQLARVESSAPVEKMFGSGKRLPAFELNSKRTGDGFSGETDNSDDELDEKSPFSHEGGNAGDREARKRISVESDKDSVAVTYPRYQTHHGAFVGGHRNPISLSNGYDANCPPAFNPCQANHQHFVDIPHVANRKLDWVIGAAACAECGCGSCRLKRKLIAAETQHASNSPLTCESARLTRTGAMHLVLKSIILVLLTLLLLMILVGAILAGHFVPRLLEKLAEAKTFNVTIAG